MFIEEFRVVLADHFQVLVAEQLLPCLEHRRADCPRQGRRVEVVAARKNRGVAANFLDEWPTGCHDEGMSNRSALIVRIVRVKSAAGATNVCC